MWHHCNNRAGARPNKEDSAVTFSGIRAMFPNVVHSSDHGFMTNCVCHEDDTPSLSIRLSDDGERIFLKCFAGCSEADILAKLGLTKADLFTRQTVPKGEKVSEIRYDYRELDGALLYSKIRREL